MNLFIYSFIGIVGSFIIAIKTPLFFMVGSWATVFSAVSTISPLSGYFGGAFGGMLYLAFRLAWHLFFSPTHVGMSWLINIVPGWCSTMFWSFPPVIGSVFVPVIALCLFVMHPVGGQAFVYALLWLIPIALYACRYAKNKIGNTFFAQALCATFVAHAVGSVMWLYGMPAMKPELWILLTPIALAERFFFAVGITLARLLVINLVDMAKMPLTYMKNAVVRIAR